MSQAATHDARIRARDGTELSHQVLLMGIHVRGLTSTALASAFLSRKSIRDGVVCTNRENFQWSFLLFEED